MLVHIPTAIDNALSSIYGPGADFIIIDDRQQPNSKRQACEHLSPGKFFPVSRLIGCLKRLTGYLAGV